MIDEDSAFGPGMMFGIPGPGPKKDTKGIPSDPKMKKGIEIKNMKKMNHLPTFEDFLNEEYVSPQEKERRLREAEAKLKESIKKIHKLIKDEPEKSEIHKAELDVALAKQTVFDLIKKLKGIKERYQKNKK